jgi:hypothetical protein
MIDVGDPEFQNRASVFPRSVALGVYLSCAAKEKIASTPTPVWNSA